MKKICERVLLASATLIMTMLYGATVFAAPAQVQNVKQVSATDNMIKIEWDAVEGEDIGYEIQKTTDKNFKSNIVSLKTSDTKYSFYDLIPGTSYYVRINAYQKMTETAAEEETIWSEEIEIVTAPGIVGSIKQASATTSTVTITWPKTVGATSYKIFAGNKYLGETKGLSYNIADFTQSTISVYSSRKSKTYEAYINRSIISVSTFKFLPEKVKNVSVNDYNAKKKTAKVIWAEARNKEGYNIQYSAYNSQKVIKSYNVTVRSCDLANIKSNKFYKVRVRAYTTINGAMQYGEWSDYAYLCQAVKPKLKKKSTNKIAISWKKVKGATSYSVYVSNNDKTYKKVTTTKKLKYTLSKFKKKKLKNKKIYSVYVVANRKVGGKTYSSEKKVVTRMYLKFK